MKGKSKVLTVALALVLVTGVAVSWAAAGGARAQGGRRGFEHHMLCMMTDYLDLTDAQQAQVKQIFAAEKAAVLPLVQQLHQTRRQLRQLEQSSSFDEGKVRAIAGQQAQTMTELTVEKSKVANQIFNLLTPDQKAKAQKFMERREARFQKHFEDNAEPPQQ
jgi:Spy/CpxP family protein refolding chaperone